MLVQNHVELNRKKGAANILVVILLILIAMSGVFILWSVVNKVILLSPEENCFDYIGFSLEGACYLSENEIKVTLKRGFDDEEIRKLSFMFFPSNSFWEITGKKCLDVRLANNDKYGGYLFSVPDFLCVPDRVVCCVREHDPTTHPTIRCFQGASLWGSSITAFYRNREGRIKRTLSVWFPPKTFKSWQWYRFTFDQIM